jgi:hypothetical protein
MLTFGDFLFQKKVYNLPVLVGRLHSVHITRNTKIVDAWVREVSSWSPDNVLLAKTADGATTPLVEFPRGTVLVVKERPY